MFLFLIFTYVFVHVQVHMCVRVFRLCVCVYPCGSQRLALGGVSQFPSHLFIYSIHSLGYVSMLS